MAARRTPPGILGGTTGMSDRVRLGGGGTLKTSARVVLRARLEPDPGDAELDRYWVGRFFDEFDGTEWKGSGKEQPAKQRVQLGPSTSRYLVQRIELLPAYDSRTLVGIDAPLIFDGATVLSTTGQSNTGLIEVSGEEVRFSTGGNAYTYTVASRVPQGVSETEASVEPKYLVLPPGLDPRIAQLAQTIAGTETDPRRVARMLEAHLRTRYSYTLELAGDLDAPLSDFLFTRKEGHCEHFATALAVMLRTRGIPARVTAGFFGGERINDRYMVRAGDAHAWVQAFIARWCRCSFQPRRRCLRWRGTPWRVIEIDQRDTLTRAPCNFRRRHKRSWPGGRCRSMAAAGSQGTHLKHLYISRHRCRDRCSRGR